MTATYVDGPRVPVYSVHMKSVTPTEARKNWFRLLDEVASGEVVEIRRGASRIVLRCEPLPEEPCSAPDYSLLITAPDVEQADQWGWDWNDDGLVSTGP